VEPSNQVYQKLVVDVQKLKNCEGIWCNGLLAVEQIPMSALTFTKKDVVLLLRVSDKCQMC
jgi:hypothetical protein